MSSEKKVGKWMWMGVLAFVALQIYFVQEMLAALMLFAGVFALLALVALGLYLIDGAGQWSLEWAGKHAGPALQLARRGWARGEERRKKLCRQPRPKPGREARGRRPSR